MNALRSWIATLLRWRPDESRDVTRQMREQAWELERERLAEQRRRERRDTIADVLANSPPPWVQRGEVSGWQKEDGR